LGGAAIIGLSAYMSSFNAALLVGVVSASIGVVTIFIGYRQLQK
jgi:hypothetical protein